VVIFTIPNNERAPQHQIGDYCCWAPISRLLHDSLGWWIHNNFLHLSLLR